MKEIGFYIHIPFCKQKCYYCDFCSFANKGEVHEKYVDCLVKEIKNIKQKDKYLITTIYFGGGTPSILKPSCIEKILKFIMQNFKVADNAEITIELNPGTVDEGKLKEYKKAGINRLSIGLQSSNDKILKEIGRIHNFEQFENTYILARKIGFKNINVDLMIGLPNQKVEDVHDTLNKIIEKNPEHISVYSLIVEEGTVMEELINENKLKLPNEDTERKMYWDVINVLKRNGYNQYEISNFSKKGFESKHNMNCWKQKEYIGVGVAAHSYLDKKRFSNICDVDEYIKNIEENNYSKNKIIHEIQDEKSEMDEYMILGLRMLDGVNIEEFYLKFEKNPLVIYEKNLNKLQKEGLIVIDENSIKLSKKGLDFGNIVWEEFV